MVLPNSKNRGVSTTGLRTIAGPTTGHATRGTTGPRGPSTLNILGGKGANAQISTSRSQTAGSFVPRSSVPKQSTTLGASLPGFKTSFDTASKGGGAFRAIGTNGQASFNVHPANGTLKLSVPIHTSPARGGFGPELQLAYDSGAGNGPFGIGWHLSLSAVSRKTAHGIPLYRHEEEDEFTLGGTDLVPRLEDDQIDVQCVGEFRITKYRPRVDPQAMRIEKWTSIADNSDVHWRTISADNVTSIYGETDASRILDSTGHKRVFSWLLTRTFDSLGNAVSYIYKAEDGANLFSDGIVPIWEQNRPRDQRCRQKYLKRISYGNLTPARNLDTWKPLPVEDWPDLRWMFEVVLDYGEHDASVPRTTEDTPWSVRQDPLSTANGGFEVRTYRLCRRFLMFHHLPEAPDYPDEMLVSSTSLTYKESGQGTFLSSATASGHAVAEADKERGIATSYTSESLPPSTFTYTVPLDLRQTRALRANIANLADIPRPGSLAEWLDLDGEGIPGLLTRSSDGTLSYQRNNGDQTFSAPEVLGQQPSLGTGRLGRFSDLDRNGRLDLVCVDGNGQLQGFYERESDSDTWSEYSEFPQTPVSEPQHQGISIDLTGEGTPDLLLQQGDVEHELIWQQSLGKQGMSGHRRTSGINTSPDTQQTYVADMTGDGLSDLVRIGGTGKITYFPNHGYGTFGDPVEMGNPPVIESFDPERVRFIDVDGSGPTDLVYILPTGGVHIYFNQAGNSWTAPLLVSKLPRIVEPSSVFVLDLLGQGTACLCWHDSVGNGPVTTEIKYIDLMGGSKPHLLQSYENGMGAVTSVVYAPSTRFYLKDRASGKPWTTRLPFPVQCVSQLNTQDCITGNVSTTEYEYHNGCYDSVERTFAGFEMVETWVRGSVPLGDEGVYQAPASYTRSWFHVGLSLRPDETGFCTPSSVASAIKNPSETPTLTQEALVALRGSPLRVETYGLDGSARERSPYIVQESSYDVEQLQHHVRGKTLHAVFRVTPRSSLSTDYGRSLEDGRVTQEVVLAMTPWGDVARSLVIVYPRASKYMSDIEYDDVKASQRAGHVVMAEYSYTNAVVEETTQDSRVFRRPVAWQHQVYDISGFPFAGSIMSVDGLRSLDVDKWSKTLLSDERAFFRDSQLNDILAPGRIEAFSVLSQSFTLAFTPELVAKITAGQQQCGMTPDTAPGLTVDQILREGGFVQLDGDKNWWQPSSRAFFANIDTEEDELARARRTFYQPIVSVDAFDHRSTLTLDKYNLMAEQTTDALGNSVRFVNDYTHLQPVRITDANQNTYAVMLSPLGEAIAVAVLGKPTNTAAPGDVDSLDGIDPEVCEADIKAILTEPDGAVARRLLGNAGSRTIPVRDAFVRAREPTFTITITRDRSFRQLGEAMLHVVVAYMQGSGSVIQQAALNEDAEWLISGCEAAAPIRVLDPFFASTPAFVPVDKCPSNAHTAFYDTQGHCVAQLAPDHSWTKTVYSPWRVVQWHEGDTLPVSDPRSDPDVGLYFSRIAASRYLPTWLEQQGAASPSGTQSRVYTSQTPVTTHLGCHPAAPQVRSVHKAGSGQTFTISFGYDAAGNQTHSWDNLERLTETALFDKLGRPIQARGMDTGDKYTIQDVTGAPIVSWNSRGVYYHYRYDALRRETECWLLVMPASPIGQKAEAKLVVQTLFGESCDSYTDAVTANLRGRAWKIRDQSGEHTQIAYDVRGHCIRSKFQAAVEYKAVLDWHKKENTQFESRCFENGAKFDNFGSPVWEVDVQGNETRRVFSRRGHALRVEVRHVSKPDEWQTYLVGTTYEADGLPLSVTYGNGTRTTCTYHPQSRHLLAQRTVSVKAGGGKKGAEIKEDLSFAYDIVGRRVSRSNKADKPVLIGDTRVSADFTYNYDAIGQLVSATGRGQLPAGATQLQPHSAMSGNTDRIGPVQGDRLYNYKESYTYDLAGNMTRMRHEALGGGSISGWTRRFYYEEPSLLSDDGKVMGNKLSRTSVGRKEQRYTIDNTDDEEWPEGSANLDDMDNSRHNAGRVGCMTSLPGFALLRWNADNQLAAASTQRINGGVPTTTYYVYDHTGRRVWKVTESEAAEGGATPRRQRETLFLGGAELKTIYTGQGSQRWVATVGDGAGDRLALIEGDESSTAQLVRYQVGDDLELDEEGRLVSYEEYTPFGSPIFTTASRTIQARREYRFSRYRWDRETGLFACGARYYCPWLGRWTAPDPLGDVDGPNLYVYVGNDPINFHDPLGTCGTKRSKSQANFLTPKVLSGMNTERNVREAGLYGGKTNPSAGKTTTIRISANKPGLMRGTSSSQKTHLPSLNNNNNSSNNINVPDSRRVTNMPKLGKGAIENLGQVEKSSKFYIDSRWDHDLKPAPGMTNAEKMAVTRMQNDRQVAQTSRAHLNHEFKGIEGNLQTLGDSLYKSRTMDTKKTPALAFRKTVQRHINVLKDENSSVPFSSPKYIRDHLRYQAVENAVSGSVNFANNKLGPGGPTSEQVEALETVKSQRDYIAGLYVGSIKSQEVVRDNCHSYQTNTLTEKNQFHRPWLYSSKR